MQSCKSYIILVFIIFVLVSKSACQENSVFINSYINPFITNAGCTGSEYYPVGNISVKKQWMGFPNSPSTFIIAGNTRLGQRDFYNSKYFLNKKRLMFSDRIGLGAAIFHDINGPLSNTGAFLSYAYHVPTGNENRLSFGLSALIANYACNNSILKTTQSVDNYLLNGNENVFKLNAGVGIYYCAKSFFGGISANKLLPGISNAGEYTSFKPSYFIMGGYKFNRKNIFFNFEPSINIKKLPNENLIFDVHAKIYVQRLNWLAISYSSTKLLNVQFAIRLYKMTYIGYNYGYSISKIAQYNSGTHEISLGINMGLVGIKGIRNTF